MNVTNLDPEKINGNQVQAKYKVIRRNRVNLQSTANSPEQKHAGINSKEAQAV